MARRAALIALTPALASCGSKSWTCAWQCSSNVISGTATYPDGPDPTQQRVADHGSACNSFSCSCNQG